MKTRSFRVPSTGAMMKIGMMLPGTMALSGRGDGVRIQAIRQADALTALGHEVIRMNPWEYTDSKACDLVHMFMGGYLFKGIETARSVGMMRMLAFAPIIDSNEPHWRYRLAAKVGHRKLRFSSLQWEYSQQARGSDLVIARSKHEQHRMVNDLGADLKKVHIVLNGMNVPDRVDPNAVRRKLQLPEHFLLHVSAYTQPRKNVVRLLEAVGPTEYPIVIAGSSEPGPVLDRIKALADQFRHITLLGFIDADTLNGLYAACRVFCLPTDHEGTGLVALEAASLGARVVITRNGGPPDYFLNLAEYVDPFNVEDIRAAIVRAWNAAPSDALRQHVVKNLTWEQSAQALVAAYVRCMPGRHQHA